MPDSAHSRLGKARVVASDHANACRDAHVDAVRRRHDGILAAMKAAKRYDPSALAEAVRTAADAAEELARLDLEGTVVAEVIGRLSMELLSSETTDEQYLAWRRENQRIALELTAIGAITVSEDGLANARAQQRALNTLAAGLEAEHTSA